MLPTLSFARRAFAVCNVYRRQYMYPMKASPATNKMMTNAIMNTKALLNPDGSSVDTSCAQFASSPLLSESICNTSTIDPHERKEVTVTRQGKVHTNIDTVNYTYYCQQPNYLPPASFTSAHCSFRLCIVAANAMTTADLDGAIVGSGHALGGAGVGSVPVQAVFASVNTY